LQNCSEIPITFGDFHRLDAGRYLNDTLIEFGINYYWAKLGHSAGKARQFGQDEIHVFTSFFFKTLSVPDKQRDENDDHEYATWEAYENVKAWIKKTKLDIFDKRLLLVPIHEEYHWYLAAILNPGAILKDGALGRVLGVQEKSLDKDSIMQEEEMVDMQLSKSKLVVSPSIAGFNNHMPMVMTFDSLGWAS
jgi:Ulp1 family protease